MNCNICQSLSDFVFKKTILQKYEVSYFRCTSCEFIQTEKPYWLEEAYKLPFTPLDIYLASRPLELSQATENLIFNYFNYKEKFLDYGGGIGLFTRIMRDRGLNFYRQDKYAQNLFSQYFDIDDLNKKEREFELLTTFEVLEHLENPIDEFSQMFLYGKNIFCSTWLQPNVPIEELESWEYLGELHGQHISFFTKKSMGEIAEKFNCYFYTNNVNLHLFTQKKIDKFTVERISYFEKTFPYRIKKRIIHLIERGYEMVFHQPGYPSQALTTEDAIWIKKKLTQKT